MLCFCPLQRIQSPKLVHSFSFQFLQIPNPAIPKSPFFRSTHRRNAVVSSRLIRVSMSNLHSTTAAAASSSSQYTYSAATTPYFPTPFHLQQTPPPPPVPYIGAAPPPPVPVPVYPASSTVYSLPQYQQAQQLFQRDAQTITPEALESVKAALANSDIEHKAETRKKAIPRKAAGQSWEDPTLAEWPENDYRLFCGDLGNEVNDDVLSKAFARFPTFNMARVVRDKRTGKTKGYGFISFANPSDLVGALKEMNGKYVGNRPIKLRKSTWTERTDTDALGRQKHHSQKKTKQPKRSVLHK